MQASLLIAGVDPSRDQHYVEEWEARQRPHGYEAAKDAIVSALESNKILCELHYPDPDGVIPYDRGAPPPTLSQLHASVITAPPPGSGGQGPWRDRR